LARPDDRIATPHDYIFPGSLREPDFPRTADSHAPNHRRHHGTRGAVSSSSRVRNAAASLPLIIAAVRASARDTSNSSIRRFAIHEVLAQHFDGL